MQEDPLSTIYNRHIYMLINQSFSKGIGDAAVQGYLQQLDNKENVNVDKGGKPCDIVDFELDDKDDYDILELLVRDLKNS